MNFLLLATVGFIGGSLSGALGIGYGVVVVPTLLYAVKVEPQVIVAAVLASGIALGISATLAHGLLGNVKLWLVIPLAVGALMGGFAGARITGIVPAETLRFSIGAMLVVVGFTIVLGWFR